jgi:hypothetical protein
MSEKRKPASPGQDKELLAAVVRQFPYGEIDKEQAQFLVSDYDGLHYALLNALNFDPARYFRSLLAACRQDEVSTNFNSDCFPVEPLASDEEEWVECLYGFAEDVVGLRALQDMLKLGYRPCGVRRAMKYLAQNPGLQDKNHIVVTSVGKDNEYENCLPVFSRDRRYAKRCVLLNSVECTYGTTYRWLVLCPRAAAPPVEMGLLDLYDACRIDKWQAFIDQERPSILEEVAPADGWELHVHHFTETVTGEHAMCVHGLTMCDYRYLGGMRRGLEYMARLKDLPCPLALSFEVQDAHGHRCIPLVWQTGLTRRLRLVPIEKKFPPSVGWLVLRSKATQEEK